METGEFHRGRDELADANFIIDNEDIPTAGAGDGAGKVGIEMATDEVGGLGHGLKGGPGVFGTDGSEPNGEGIHGEGELGEAGGASESESLGEAVDLGGEGAIGGVIEGVAGEAVVGRMEGEDVLLGERDPLGVVGGKRRCGCAAKAGLGVSEESEGADGALLAMEDADGSGLGRGGGEVGVLQGKNDDGRSGGGALNADVADELDAAHAREEEIEGDDDGLRALELSEAAFAIADGDDFETDAGEGAVVEEFQAWTVADE